MRTVTIKDVALHAGVSPKTVSRVMNGEQHVRAEVRDLVLRVVEELDYRPNIFARGLSSSRSYLIGLFLDDPGSGYAAELQLGTLLRCRQRSYHLVVEPVDLRRSDWPRLVTDSIRALRLDGAILTPPICDEAAVLTVFEDAGLPYVRISPSIDLDRSGMVAMDDRAAAYEMTGHLITRGHRRIGFIKGDRKHRSSGRRFDGFVAAMADAGLCVDPTDVREGDFSLRSGMTLGNEILSRGTYPTAIFASNDDMALGVLMTATRLGIAIPEQLAIAGFDDSPSARAAWPQLTTIRQPGAEMAARAVDILIDAGYRTQVTNPVFKASLQYQLIVRGSSDPRSPDT